MRQTEGPWQDLTVRVNFAAGEAAGARNLFQRDQFQRRPAEHGDRTDKRNAAQGDGDHAQPGHQLLSHRVLLQSLAALIDFRERWHARPAESRGTLAGAVDDGPVTPGNPRRLPAFGG